jgi:hypothetical protein
VERRNKTFPRSRENRGVVDRSATRPSMETVLVENPQAQAIVGETTVHPLTQSEEREGRQYGGGTSREAIRRARKRLGFG